MTNEQKLINEIFEKYLESDLSMEARQQIADVYGEEIASKVNVICRDAIDCPIDWCAATLDHALPILRDLLNSKYPWLTTESRKKINYAFILT